MARCRVIWYALTFLAALPLIAFSDNVNVDHQMPEVQAWESFMNAARDVGSEFLRRYPQGTESERAEALEYLSQQLATSVQLTFADRDRDLPLLRLGATNIGKWGLDGADARYVGAALDPAGRYRLSGRLGTARVTAVQIVRDHPTYAAYGSLADADLGSPGSEVSILIAAERPATWYGPWLELSPQANRLLIREYFGDWGTEQPATWRLERLDPSATAAPLPVLRDATTALGLVQSRFENRLHIWMPWIERTRERLVNRLVQLSPDGQGLTNNVYGEGWFRLADDEVLLIEMDAPQAALWSFQLGNLWWESLDYIHRTGSINGYQALPDSDGRYRIVIAATDPGYANWLDTSGHGEGAIMYRFQNSHNAPLPTARLLKRSALAAAMPFDATRVSPKQRSVQIAERRVHAQRRWSP